MQSVSLPASALLPFAQELLVAHGASATDAHRVADALIAADLEGVSSHGLMLLPMYLARIRAGSVSVSAQPEIAEDFGGLVVLRAHHVLGQVSAQVAVDLAIARAREHGLAAIAVREAFHFGAAAYWARQFTAAGMVGFALSNTRPLMPAPGGAERVVGNNPLAVAFPAASGEPLVVDMAMSATAMGKIRLAQSQGQPIPQGWATDAQGKPTTSPAEAIAGMLLPAAGPKGFGLAVAVDLLCGALSAGHCGSAVQGLYGDPAVHYDCAHAFIAIDASRVGGGAGIGAQVQSVADEIRHSQRAEADQPIYAPGDLERTRRASALGRCALAPSLIQQLNDEAQRAGIATRLAS